MKFIFSVLLALSMLACGKADISQQCTMNGFGKGQCTFTNLGTSKGSVCGTVAVTENRYSLTTRTSVFCSGEVEPKSTVSVSFSNPFVSELCEAEGKTWDKVCDFTFEAM